jgi:AbrB family looped-hinge helix DNA binding protein
LRGRDGGSPPPCKEQQVTKPRSAPQQHRPTAARVDAKGRITLPMALRRALGILPGQKLLLRQVGAELHVIAAATLLHRQRSARQALHARLHAAADKQSA